MTFIHWPSTWPVYFKSHHRLVGENIDPKLTEGNSGIQRNKRSKRSTSVPYIFIFVLSSQNQAGMFYALYYCLILVPHVVALNNGHGLTY